MADTEFVELAIKIPKEDFERCKKKFQMRINIMGNAIANGTLIPSGHGRLGDLDELEQRVSRFVERDAHITDEYTVARQRFIIEGIRETDTIIKADTESEVNTNADRDCLENNG